MRMRDQCIPCVVNQAIKVAEMVGLKEKGPLLQKAFAYLSGVDFGAACTPELIGEMFALLKEETGDPDPYRSTRQHANRLFLDRLPQLEREIDASDNPLQAAIRYAIIGNIIDFNPIHSLTLADIETAFERLKGEPLEIDDSALLAQKLSHANSLLYLGDNCGEICLDRLLIKKLREHSPACRFYFATRGAAVVNDSVEEDAYAVGMDAYAAIISNGDISLGTVLPRTSQEFREAYAQADIVIAKGQANYECLSEEKKDIFFLLMSKCKVIAEDIGVPEMKLICMNSRK